MRIKIFLFSIICLVVTACDHIDDGERLIYVPPASVQRCVLLEDFTGQRCINCPKANDEIASRQEQYGENNVIAVGIHAGPLAFQTNAKFVGLKTDTGEEYYNYWNPDHQPIATVNRQGLNDYTQWNAKVREELQKTAPVRIEAEALLTDGSLSITTNVTGIEGNISGKLQLWLTEDNVQAFQLMPDGTRSDDYLHQHVFRATVNGTWGEDINIEEGKTLTLLHQAALSKEWLAANLSVVVFVYDHSGILQVTKVRPI